MSGFPSRIRPSVLVQLSGEAVWREERPRCWAKRRRRREDRKAELRRARKLKKVRADFSTQLHIPPTPGRFASAWLRMRLGCGSVDRDARLAAGAANGLATRAIA